MQAVFGTTNPDPSTDTVRRYAAVIGLEPGMEQRYRELHADTWPSVTARLAQSSIRNYSIYLAEIDGRKYLFSYFEYSGTDFVADLQAVADDPETRRWWQETDPCQLPLPNRPPGARWCELERLFFMP